MIHFKKRRQGRSLLLIGSLLLSATCFAQLEEVNSKPDWKTIGEVKWISTTKARLQYLVQRADTSYWLYLKSEKVLKNNRDMPVVSYFSLHFQNDGNALGALQSLLLSFFDDEHAKDKAYEKTFRLGNTLVLVQHYSRIFGKGILLTTKDGYIVLNKNDLKKLFALN